MSVGTGRKLKDCATSTFIKQSSVTPEGDKEIRREPGCRFRRAAPPLSPPAEAPAAGVRIPYRGQTDHAVRIHAAQVRADQAVRHDAGIVRRYVEAIEDGATECSQVLGFEAWGVSRSGRRGFGGGAAHLPMPPGFTKPGSRSNSMVVLPFRKSSMISASRPRRAPAAARTSSACSRATI